GRGDVMAMLEHRDDPEWQRRKRISHPGTFNANPVSAAAGVACLEIVRDPGVQKKATATADALRGGMNDVLKRRGVAGSAGGEVSLLSLKFDQAKAGGRDLLFKYRGAMQLGGVDPSGLNLIVSSVHDERDVEQTIKALDQAVEMLQAEGAV